MRRVCRAGLPHLGAKRIRGGFLSLKVVRLAAGSSLQDGGRFGFRKFGVPNGGAFDSESAFLANSLLGNLPIAAVLEIPVMGGVFESLADTTVAVVGATCLLNVSGLENLGQARILVGKGCRLEIGPAQAGARSYLAVPAGFVGEPILDSLSGVPVPDLLEFSACLVGRPAKLAEAPSTLGRRVLRFMPGPQAHLLDLKALCSMDFAVSPQSDRKGLRLDGAFEGTQAELPSEPACFGAIQVTPSGMPIILGPDGPTIGGYPKIGVVTSADLAALGQLAPGNRIRLEQVTFDQALALWQTESYRLRRLRNALLARLNE